MSRPIVLIVEDDPDLSELLEELLASHGFGVAVARSTSTALELASQSVFDLIVTDLLVDTAHVPDAWEQVDRLRAIAPGTPIGVLSGMRIAAVESTARGLCFSMQKPVSSETFLAAVSGALPSSTVDSRSAWLIRTYFACIERHEWDRLADLLSHHVHYHVAGSDPVFSRTVRGRPAFIELARETFATFIEPRFAIESIRRLPEGFIVQYTGSWGEPGARSSMPGALVMKLAGNLIEEVGVRLNLENLRNVLVSKQA